MGKFIDLTGHRYGRLVVIERAENNKHGTSQFLCQCDCGNKKIICGKYLRDGDTISCGCFQKEVASNAHRKHGFRGTRLYHVWQDMKTLCYNSNDSRYKYYGGRGITVCDEWKDNFQAFYDWAMESGYKEEILPSGYNKWTIERIDNNGNFEPDNCCWATMKAQANNTRRNHLIEHNGAEFTATQVAEESGLRADTLLWRIKSKKMPIQEAIETPNKIKRYEYKGKIYTTTQIKKDFGISADTFKKRIRNGMTVAEAIETPKTGNLKYEYKGVLYTAAEIQKVFGIKSDTFCNRLRCGLTINEAIEIPVRHWQKKNENLSNAVSN